MDFTQALPDGGSRCRLEVVSNLPSIVDVEHETRSEGGVVADWA